MPVIAIAVCLQEPLDAPRLHEPLDAPQSRRRAVRLQPHWANLTDWMRRQEAGAKSAATAHRQHGMRPGNSNAAAHEDDDTQHDSILKCQGERVKWPTAAEVAAAMEKAGGPKQYRAALRATFNTGQVQGWCDA